MQILDGSKIAGEILAEVNAEVQTMVEKGMKVPHLAAVLVGEDPASMSYIRNKVKSCDLAGFRSTLIHENDKITEEQLLDIIHKLNDDEDIDGFIVQLPLPKHIDADKINLAIDYRKDVDGFHPVNFGRMAQGLEAFLPATPSGILQMLKRANIETEGKHCVVLGRSNIVGLPMAMLMARKANPGNCTVTIAHSRSKDIEKITRQADILIAAIGIPKFVSEDMVKQGVVVIDVGMTRIEDPTTKSGFKLVGDVDFDQVSSKCSYITPVPKGVGPMTVCSLILNTLKAAKGEIYPKS